MMNKMKLKKKKKLYVRESQIVTYYINNFAFKLVARRYYLYFRKRGNVI